MPHVESFAWRRSLNCEFKHAPQQHSCLLNRPFDILGFADGLEAVPKTLERGRRPRSMASAFNSARFDLLCIAVMVQSFPVEGMVDGETEGLATTELPCEFFCKTFET